MTNYPVGFADYNEDSDTHFGTMFGNDGGMHVFDDGAGNTYMAMVDRFENPKVNVYDMSDGSLTKSIGVFDSTPGDGELDRPEYVTIDSSENYYITDRSGTDRLQKFNSSGVYQSKITAAADDNFSGCLYYGNSLLLSVYDSNLDEHELRIYNSSLSLQYTGTSYASSNLENLSKTNSWIIGWDSSSSVIRRYDGNLARVDSVSPTNGCQDLAVNPAGNTYFYNLKTNREIERRDEDLTNPSTVVTLGSEQTGVSQTLTPQALKFDADGYAYVSWANTGNYMDYVVKYDPSDSWSVVNRRTAHLGFAAIGDRKSTFALARTADATSHRYRIGTSFTSRHTQVDYESTGADWHIDRVNIQIDTRSLGSVPAAMDLVLYVDAVTDDSGSGELVLAEGAIENFTQVPAQSSYNSFHTKSECASRTALSGLSAGSTVTISLNATGLAQVNAGGFTTFSLMIGWDYDNSSPGFVTSKTDSFEFDPTLSRSYLAEPATAPSGGYAIVI
jgi:hypothetical protein